MQQLGLRGIPKGIPILYDHESKGGFQIGHVKRGWLDSEGWLRIEAEIELDTLSGRAAAAQVEHGSRTGLSLTHEYDLMERIFREPGWFESKMFKDVTILQVEEVEREGCFVLKGERTEIEERDRISEHAEAPVRSRRKMDPKEKAQYELELKAAMDKRDSLAKDLEEFTKGARLQEDRMAVLTGQLKERDDKETALRGQLDSFFQRDRANLAAKQQELAGLLPPEAGEILDKVTGLATDSAGIENVNTLYTLVSENMRMPGRDEQEALVQGFKSQLTSAAGTDALVNENKKRFRPDPNSSADGPLRVTVTRREMAVLDAVKRDHGAV